MWSNKDTRERQEEFYKEEKRRQAGIAFPSAMKQEHLLIVRFDTFQRTLDESDRKLVRTGLHHLCELFERIDSGKFKMDHLLDDGELKSVPLSDFNFTATLGFGKGSLISLE